jgi:hypothetical protein
MQFVAHKNDFGIKGADTYEEVKRASGVRP